VSHLYAGGAAAGLGLAYLSLGSGIASMDRAPIRGSALLFGVANRVPPKLVMGVLNNESKGLRSLYVGDRDAEIGPSIGPMQVSRQLALNLKLWTPSDPTDRDAYVALATSLSEVQLMAWGCFCLGYFVRGAKGSFYDALTHYNGSSVYADEVDDFLQATYGWDIGS
jgi:hypothetical protein